MSPFRLLGALLLAGSAGAAPISAAAYNRLLAHTVNFGNMLEAPDEGARGLTVRTESFDLVRRAGFTAVRLPVNWSAHAAPQAPYTIDPAFLKRVDRAVNEAVRRRLAVIVDFHGDEGMDGGDPQAAMPRFLGLWRQLSAHFRAAPPLVAFELLNEPHGQLNDRPELWNDIAARAVAVIRRENPTRPIILGPTGWNGPWALGSFAPPKDPALILTVHDYEPLRFTHQGAEWMDGSADWLGTRWTGSGAERAALKSTLQTAADWARAHHLPLFVGEFGSYGRADMASRVRWTTAMRQTIETLGASWGYWEFNAGFGVYDPAARAWRPELLKALLPNTTAVP